MVGSRELVATPICDALAFFGKTTPMKSLRMKDLFSYFKGMQADTIKSYGEDSIVVGGVTRKPLIMQGTAGAMDLVLMPAGWMLWERVGNGDVVGVRSTVLVKSSDVGLRVVNDRLRV